MIVLVGVLKSWVGKGLVRDGGNEFQGAYLLPTLRLVNGEPEYWFNGQRGVRQGDPLSPFLFVIVVDVLSRLVSRVINNGFVMGLTIGSQGVLVSHL